MAIVDINYEMYYFYVHITSRVYFKYCRSECGVHCSRLNRTQLERKPRDISGQWQRVNSPQPTLWTNQESEPGVTWWLSLSRSYLLLTPATSQGDQVLVVRWRLFIGQPTYNTPGDKSSDNWIGS